MTRYAVPRRWTWTMVAGLALVVMAAGQPVRAADGWTAPTESSFWSNAASAATATIYAPASPPLHRARVGSFDFAGSRLNMYCADQWSVTAVYGTSGIRTVTLEQGTDNGSQEPVCLGDGPGANGPPNETTVVVAGARITIDFWGCEVGPKPYGFPEATCPVSKASYIADGRLPAAGAKRATALHISSLGISRRQLTAIIRSLTVVAVP